MTLTSRDQAQFTELFDRIKVGGPQVGTAMRQFEDKATAFGLDSVQLYNNLLQGRSLALYQPPSTPAVPKTETGDGSPPDIGRYPDTVRIRLYCSKVEKPSIATFRKDEGGRSFLLQGIVREEAAGSQAGRQALPAAEDFPVGLLNWTGGQCPHCQVNMMRKDVYGPIHCGDCGKLRCLSGVHSRLWRNWFKCVCGSDGPIGPPVDTLKLELPSAVRRNMHTPPAADHSPRLQHSRAEPAALPSQNTSHLRIGGW